MAAPWLLASFAITALLAAPSCEAIWRGPPKLRAASQGHAALYFQQKLDHFDPEDSRIWQQKYFEDLAFFRKPHGPIFMFLCGEGPCESTDLYVKNVAEIFGGAVVTLQHRYYGNGSPFPSSNLTVENLRYLSSRQALVDAAVFVSYYQELINERYGKEGMNRWIVVGASYAGALSAWLRLKFPHLVVGSWASSAVVQAVLEFPEYEEQVGVDIGPTCKKLVQIVTKLIENSLDENPALIKALFSAEQLSDDDFLKYVSSPASYAAQNGIQRELCDPLESIGANEPNLLLAKFAELTPMFAADPHYYNPVLLKAAVQANDDYARFYYCWYWQVCTEFGFFQVAPTNDSICSARVNTQYMLHLCARLFGDDIYPDVNTTNLYYGGDKISGTKIMFLNGSQDPWRHASRKTSTTEEGFSAKCVAIRESHHFIVQQIGSWLSS